MRREEYERTYGRRGMPPPMSPPMQESSQNRKSRRKMKCLISIGLILPALAAVIGVAAWAVSADVVMNSGSRVKANNNNNQLLQANDQGQDRGDVFRNNQPPSQGDENQRRSNMQGRPLDTQQIPPSPKRRTTPSTPSPPSATDVSSILSKLISASSAASGGNGPRFVVVAPLPDHGKVVDEEEAQEAERPSSVARVDNSNIRYADHSPRQPTRNVASGSSYRSPSYNQQQYADSSSGNHDLMPSASSQHYQQVQPYHGSSSNVSSRVGLSPSQTNPRRSGEQPFVINLSSNNHRRDFNSQPLDMAGFEPFLSPQTLLGTSSNHQQGPPPPPPGYMASGPFTANSKKRPQPQSYFPPHNQHHAPPPQQHPKPGPPNVHGGYEQSHPSHFNPLPSNGGSNSGFGLKPIQKHLHHHDPPPHPHPSSIKDGNNNPHGPPPRADESNRWGTIGFPPGGFAPEPPKGISLSISSPSTEFGHKEPVSVIKSFFLPFLPKPRVNLNARVVFGVVLDKGLGLGGKKDGGHHHHPVY